MDITREQWADMVADVLSAHPEFAAVTVQAMQEGILAAVARESDRRALVSMGLVEALNTKPRHVKRNHDRIITAIEASTFHPTTWSAAAIEKEQK
jgi:hypothetical protein